MFLSLNSASKKVSFLPSFCPKSKQKREKNSYSKMATETEKIKKTKSVQNQMLQ